MWQYQDQDFNYYRVVVLDQRLSSDQNLKVSQRKIRKYSLICFNYCVSSSGHSGHSFDDEDYDDDYDYNEDNYIDSVYGNTKEFAPDNVWGSKHVSKY